MSRGRLIFPFFVDIARIDYDATGVSPGFDEDFKEPKGDSAEQPLLRLKAQIVPKPKATEQLSEGLSGNSPMTEFQLAFHFKELEAKSLLDTDGMPLIRINDRLDGIYHLNGSLVQRFRNPPGVFATHVDPSAIGLGLGRNLLIVTFRSRDLSVSKYVP